MAKGYYCILYFSNTSALFQRRGIGEAEEIAEVYEVDPMVCPQCGGQMKVVSFLTDWAVVDRIINHLKLTFLADRPPPPQIAYQEVLIAAEVPAEYLS